MRMDVWSRHIDETRPCETELGFRVLLYQESLCKTFYDPHSLFKRLKMSKTMCELQGYLAPKKTPPP